MKKVLIIGATGSLALYVIEAIKQLHNIKLSLFARNTNSLAKNLSQECFLIQGDAMNFMDVKNAITGQDILYVNLAGDLESMSKNIVNAIILSQKEVADMIGLKNLYSYQRLESPKSANPALLTISKIKQIFPDLKLDLVV